MQELYELDAVTMLLADPADGIRSAAKMYADTQRAVELCAAVSTGEEVLELLRAGLTPQVIVVDALLQRPNVFSLLKEIRMLNGTYHPHILITSVAEAKSVQQKLLTLGADYTILKPYKLDELFDVTMLWGSSEENLSIYRVQEQLFRFISALKSSRKMYGLLYLEQIICCMVLSDKNYTIEELYIRVAESEQVEPEAVSSAIRRIGDAMRKADTPAYLELCKANGKPAGAHLTNAELLRGIEQCIRRALRN